MKTNLKRPAKDSARSGLGADDGREYLEFELDAHTLAQVKALAQESHCTPFALCVGLMEESLGRREQPAGTHLAPRIP